MVAPLEQVVRVALLRNPFERLASAYVDKVVRHDRKEWDYVAGWLEKRCNMSLPKFTFESFTKCIAKVPAEKLDRHFTPQVDWCGLGQLRYDYYLTTHGLESQLQALLQDHNFSVTEVPRLNVALSKGKKPDWRGFYTDATRERVAALYAEDFAMMGAMFNKSMDDYFWEGGDPTAREDWALGKKKGKKWKHHKRSWSRVHGLRGSVLQARLQSLRHNARQRAQRKAEGRGTRAV